MELKNKKYINNTKRLPGFEHGIATSPYLIMKQNLGGASFIGSGFDNAINQDSGIVSDDPYQLNKNLKPGYQKDPYIPQEKPINVQEQLPGVLNFAATAINNASPGFDHNDLMAATTNSYGNVRGVKYLRKTGISKAIDDAESGLQSRQLGNILSLMGQGANVGANFKNGKLPGFSFGGALIGGGAGLIAGALTSAISSSKADSEERMARDFINRENIFNQNGALTTVLQQDDMLLRGDQEKYKIRYKNGKCPKFAEGAEVHTSHGTTSTDNVPQNSWVDGEEKIFGADGSVHQIPPSPSGKTDTFRANVKDGDLILPKEYANLANTREQAEYVMNYIVAPEMRAKGVPGYKCGKLPGFSKGSNTSANALMTSLGVLGGGMQMLQALNSSVKRPNTYVPNTYGQRAANILAGLRVSDYPILPELYNQYAKTMYGISNSGGLSGGQKTLARLAALKNLQNNYAKLQASNQMTNNQYKASYADYISKLGAQEASDRMKASQFDLDYYSKAHAARQNGIQMGYANMMNALASGYKNQFKLDQFYDTMDLYRDDQKRNWAEIEQMSKANDYTGWMNNRDEYMEYGRKKGWWA